MPGNEETPEQSYIDYETFLDASFSPTAFANTLVLATNNASDTPLDLNTPLSRVLFDVQEVDTHLDGLTSKSALPLLQHTKDHVEAGSRILQELESQVSTLTASYERLHKEVTLKYQAAEEARVAAERLWQTLKLGRSVGRCVTLARQLEAQLNDFRGSGDPATKREDHRAMVRAANTLLSFRQIFAATGPGGEGEGLEKVVVVKSLRSDLIEPAESSIISRAEQIVGQFSMSSLTASSMDSGASSTVTASTYAQTEDTRSRATTALITLYLLSPTDSAKATPEFVPTLLISALQEYLKRAITSSLAGLSSALAALPKLERTLIEVSARCQNIVALEMLLQSITPPPHPLLVEQESAAKILNNEVAMDVTDDKAPSNFLWPLLNSLDTASLPSYFWRSMSSQLTSRVQKILKDGGVSARTLRSNKDRVRDAIRECVNRGSQLPASSLTRGKSATVGNWEREAAVMVGSVVNVLR